MGQRCQHKVIQIEFAAILDAWNVKTHIWFRECVYKRVTHRGKKPGFTSSMITFLRVRFGYVRSILFYFLVMLCYSRFTLN